MNNNPFEPVSPEPATLEQTDSAPDVFADNNNQTKPVKPAVMLDGISPAPIEPETGDIDAIVGAKPDTMNNLAAISSNPDDTASNPAPMTDMADATPVDMSKDVLDVPAMSDPMDQVKSGTETDSSDFLGQLAARKNGKLDSLLDEESADSSKKSDQKKKTDKPPRQFTISIASIILFVLAIAGIGGSVYFYMQNDSNYNKMKTYQAQVEELQNDSTNSSNSDSKSSSQFDALQTKISDLTKQVEDKQKTIDEDKTKIDDLTKKNDELTKANTDLTTKVQNISDLTTKLDTMLNKLNTIYPTTTQ